MAQWHVDLEKIYKNKLLQKLFLETIIWKLITQSNIFSPLYALFLASDVFLVHSRGNDRTGFYGFLNWFSDILCWK